MNPSSAHGSGRPPGRLAGALSLYLRSHADNPVDWRPWGQEALDAARFEDKPLFISIGYASCHWCHVMARESFEDEEIAAVLNNRFVPVKVDREERPDLDMVYMGAAVLSSGRGGWPLSCFALPDGRPFLGGTYFPPDRLKSLLAMVHDLWENDRQRILASAESLSRGIAALESPPRAGGEGPTAREAEDAAREGFSRLREDLDPAEGGLGGAPKFPMPGLILTLIERAALSGDETAAGHAGLTLRKIRDGGIHDHVGGGFARYAVDARWRIPHFEKMLYDNAALIEAYAKAFRTDPLPLYRRAAENALDFCLRELRTPEGGFYSSLDADSEGGEGRYYTWTRAEAETALDGASPADRELWLRAHNVTAAGNWEGGLSVPYRSPGRDDEDEEHRIAACSALLLAARSRRTAPARDDKVIAGWNGLMIRACAAAGGAFGREDGIEAARAAADFVSGAMRRRDGGLYAVWAGGRAAVRAFAPDYALVADGLLELYQETFEPAYLDEAERLLRYLLDHFSRDDSPFLRFRAREEEPLFAEKTEISDNVLPSSNAAAADVLLRLGHILNEDAYIRRAGEMLNAMQEPVRKAFASHYRWASVLARHAAGFVRVGASGPRAAEYLREIRKTWTPEAVYVVDETGDDGGLPPGGETRIIVCRGKTCELPAANPAEALDRMRGSRGK